MRRFQPFSRRKFLKASSLACSVPLLGGLPRSSAESTLGANDQLRLGWIGVGGRGTSLLDRALNSVSVSRLSVRGICDIDEAHRRRAIERCGAMAPAGFHDYRDLLDRKDIDAVFIATPIHLHAEHAAAAVAAGKHVYCEKPLGPTAQDVKKVYDAVRAAKTKFQVGFQWRYHGGFLPFVETIQSGAIGKVTFVSGFRHVGGYPQSGWYVDRNRSGDLIVEQAVHEMNVFCWMLDAHPLRAAGFGGTNALAEQPEGRTIMDAYAVVYEFPGGIRLNYSHVIYAADGFGGLDLTVYGDPKKACALEGTTNLFVTKDGKRTPVEIPPLKDATEAAIQHFAKAVREDGEILANVTAGRRATLMAILGRTAIRERRVVEWREVAL